MKLALDVKHLCKKYAAFELRDIDIALPCGCIMGLIGENGAGKSTTIRLILDIIHRDSGEVSILGQDISQVREHIGVIMDESCFPENLCAQQMDYIFKRIYQTWSSETYFRYMQRFHLPAKQCIKAYSRGMKVKLSIAVALSHDSKLLILDEATSGLDPIVRDEILDIFLEFIQNEECSVLLSSHIVSDLEKACDYIMLIHQGKQLLLEEKDHLMEQFGMFHGRKEEIQDLPRDAIVGVREHRFGIDALIQRDKTKIKLEPANLEDIMLYKIKGEAKCSV